MNIKVINRNLVSVWLIYAVLWAVLFIFPLVQGIVVNDGADFSWERIFRGWLSTIPYLILFLIHNHLVVPCYIRKNKSLLYLLLTLLIVGVFFAYQYIRFESVGGALDRPFGDPPPPPPPPGRHGLIPRPVLMDTFFGILLLAFNLTVAIVYKHQNDREEMKQLESMRIQDELKYLKSQIDPHFFMNMLNNIHSMIEVNTGMAQQMVVELSMMMRYILYEGRNSSTTFAKEVQFITNYIELMKQRYPSDKVSIEVLVPDNPSDKVHLPPLLFLAFVENAFKHGISYAKKTEISVFMAEEDNRVVFRCRNTKPVSDHKKESHGGIGLTNARRRLDILYRDKYVLDIVDKQDVYSVILIIPGL